MVATLGLVFTGCIAAVRPAGHGCIELASPLSGCAQTFTSTPIGGGRASHEHPKQTFTMVARPDGSLLICGDCGTPRGGANPFIAEMRNAFCVVVASRWKGSTRWLLPMMRAQRGCGWPKAHALRPIGGGLQGKHGHPAIILTKHLFGIDSDKAHKAWFDMSSGDLTSDWWM